MKNILRKIGLTLLLTIIVLPLFTQLTFADNGNTAPTPPPIIPAGVDADRLVLPHSTDTANEGDYLTDIYLPAITKSIIGLAGGMAFLFIIIGGIQILTAYGEEEKIGNAKKTITYAIVGLIISLLSYAIVSIISGIQLSPPKPDTSTDQGPAPGTEDLLPGEENEEGRYDEPITQEQALEGLDSAD